MCSIATQAGRWMVIALAIGLLCPSLGRAGKPPKPPVDDTETTTPFSVIELPGFDKANTVSNPDGDGIVTVAGTGFATGVEIASWATFALIDVATREVVSGSLPVPPDVRSDARAANVAGIIAGSAGAAPIRWSPTPTGYVYQLLPRLNGYTRGEVNAVNNAGEMVGELYDSNTAVYWSADATTVIDLNTLLPTNSAWTLTAAYDINNQRQVVGLGLLNDVERGFIFDLKSGGISAVPLVEGAVFNEAWRINDAGHVTGRTNDDIVGGGPFPQGGWGFFWGGSGTLPQLLPTFTDGAAMAPSINNHNELAGYCEVIGAPWGNGDWFMALWAPSPGGGITVTDLGTQIPSKPTWYLARDLA